MKRWGFGGLPATHGVSVSHRSAGSTGQHQDPGRVWPGTKMAGRMGGKQQTLLNLVVMRVESDLGLIFVKGNVPGTGGSRGAVVFVRDAVKKLISACCYLLLEHRLNFTVTAEAKRKELRGDENVLPSGVVDLPFPAGTVEMAKELPSIIATPSARITSPFVPKDS
jgi:large subunit ribosomal protein L3